MKNLLLSIILILIAQTLSYLQLQSQFFWQWAKQNTTFIAFLGFPISYFYIWFTKYCSEYFDGQTWPGRLIGFAMGAIVFALLSSLIMKEPINTKTIVSLILSLTILIIQFFWKSS